MLRLKVLAKHSACLIGLAIAHRVVLTVLAVLWVLGFQPPPLILLLLMFADRIAEGYHLWNSLGPLSSTASLWLSNLLWSALVYSSYICIVRHRSKEEEKKQRDRHQGVSALGDIVLPAVREVAAVLQQKGHQAEVTVNLSDPDAPAIKLILIAKARKLLRSELTFQHDVDRGRVLIRVSEKHTTVTRCDGGLSPGGSMPGASISDHETKRRVVEFIERAREVYAYAF